MSDSLLTCLEIPINSAFENYMKFYNQLTNLEDMNGFIKYFEESETEFLVDDMFYFLIEAETDDDNKAIIQKYKDIWNTVYNEDDTIEDFTELPELDNLPMKELHDICNNMFNNYTHDLISSAIKHIEHSGKRDRDVFISICPVSQVRYILPEFIINNIINHITGKLYSSDFKGYDIFIYCEMDCGSKGESMYGHWNRNYIDNDEEVKKLIEKSLISLELDIRHYEGIDILNEFKKYINIYYSKLNFDYHGYMQSQIVDFAYRYYGDFLYFQNGFTAHGGIPSLIPSKHRPDTTNLIDLFYKTNDNKNIIYLDVSGSIVKTNNLEDLKKRIEKDPYKYTPILYKNDHTFPGLKSLTYTGLIDLGYNSDVDKSELNDHYSICFIKNEHDDTYVVVGEYWSIDFYK